MLLLDGSEGTSVDFEEPEPGPKVYPLATGKSQILAFDDLERVQVNVERWGVSVFVRTMTGSERDRFEAEYRRDELKDFRAKLAVFTVCDVCGELLFTPADIPALAAKSASALQQIFDVALKLNAITKGDVEELEKN